jgi:WD40 repeat protein
MSKVSTTLSLFGSALVALSLLAQPPAGNEKKGPPPGADVLPDGARMRLGNSGLALGEAAMGGALSPDGNYLAAASRENITLFERKTGKRLAQIAGNGMPLGFPIQVAFSPTGKVMAYVGVGTVTLAEVPTGQMLHQLEVPEPKFARGLGLCFSADGKIVAVGMDQPGANKKAKAFAWEVATGKLLASYEAAQNTGCGTAISPDGKVLATWGRHVQRMIGEDAEPSQLVQLWDMASGKERQKLKVDRPNAQITAVAFSADGKTLAVVSGLTTLHLFDGESGKEKSRFAGRRGVVVTLQFSPDGKLLAAGNIEGAVQAWQTSDGKRLDLPAGPRGRVLSFAFPGERQIVALGLVGQSVTWWDAVSGKSAGAAQGHQTPVLGLAYSADGKMLTSVSFDGKVIRWDPASGQVRRQLSLTDEEMVKAMGNAMRFNTLAISPDGRFAATGILYSPTTVRLWDLSTGQVACDFEAAKTSGSYGLAFSARGERLAAAGMGKVINVWNAESGREVGNMTYDAQAAGMQSGAPRLLFSHGGKMLAVVASYFDPDDGAPGAKVLVLDSASGKELFAHHAPAANLAGAAFAGGPQVGTAVAFSHDDRLLALPGPGQTVLVVRTESGKENKRLETSGGFSAISSLAFSPDGRTIAVAHGGQRVIGPGGSAGTDAPRLQLWEVASGTLRMEFKGQQGGINCLAFSPDGLTLASGSADTTVMLWDVTGQHGQAPGVLNAAELPAEWALLAKLDGQAAFRAQRKLMGSPVETVAFLKKQMNPARPVAVDENQLLQWIADLDSENFTTRDDANRALEKLGVHAEAALKKARGGKISLEMRRRIDDLVEKLDRGILTPEELQASRAVEVLERIATTEARDLLAALAKGTPPALLTQEAQKALQRMQR